MSNPIRWLLVFVTVAGLAGVFPGAAPAAGQATTRIWTDKPQYRVGESLRYCYSVARAGFVRVTDTTPDGRSQVVVSGNDDGRGDCRSGTVSPPTGTERLRLELLVNNRVVESAETSFEVLPNAASPQPAAGGGAPGQSAVIPGGGGLWPSQVPVGPPPSNTLAAPPQTGPPQPGGEVTAPAQPAPPAPGSELAAPPQPAPPPPSSETTASAPPAPSVSVQVWTDKSRYSLGETITYCYSLSGPADVVVTDFTPDGGSQVVYAGYDARGGRCGTGTVTPPTGTERVRVEAFVGGVLQASAETSFEVTG